MFLDCNTTARDEAEHPSKYRSRAIHHCQQFAARGSEDGPGGSRRLLIPLGLRGKNSMSVIQHCLDVVELPVLQILD